MSEPSIDPRSTYDPDKANEIVQLIAEGNCASHSAESVGIPDSTFKSWRAQHPELDTLARKAKAKYLLKYMKEMDERAVKANDNTYLNHAHWKGGVLDPTRLGNRQRVDHHGTAAQITVNAPDWAKPPENKDKDCQPSDDGRQGTVMKDADGKVVSIKKGKKNKG
jgi:hypothetical protein